MSESVTQVGISVTPRVGKQLFHLYLTVNWQKVRLRIIITNMADLSGLSFPPETEHLCVVWSRKTQKVMFKSQYEGSNWTTNCG